MPRRATLDVRPTHLVEVAVWEILAGMPPLDTRTGHKNADLVSVGEDLGSERRDLLRRRHVGRVDPRLATELLNGLFCLGDAGVALFWKESAWDNKKMRFQ